MCKGSIFDIIDILYLLRVSNKHLSFSVIFYHCFIVSLVTKKKLKKKTRRKLFDSHKFHFFFWLILIIPSSISLFLSLILFPFIIFLSLIADIFFVFEFDRFYYTADTFIDHVRIMFIICITLVILSKQKS